VEGMKNFAQIPNSVCQTRNISPIAKALYIDIYSRCGKTKEGEPFYPWLSLEKIGQMIGISKHKSIRKYVDELIDFGLIRTESKQTNTGRPIQKYIPCKITKELEAKLKADTVEEEEEPTKEETLEEETYEDQFIIPTAMNNAEPKEEDFVARRLRLKQEIDKMYITKN
jgi:hypothetical protein